MRLCEFSSVYLQHALRECWIFKPSHDVVDIGQSLIQKVPKEVTIKTALKYVWSITAGVVFFVSIQSIMKDGPTGGSLFSYVLAFLYVIFRWNISQKPIEILNKLLIWVIRSFVILCSINWVNFCSRSRPPI